MDARAAAGGGVAPVAADVRYANAGGDWRWRWRGPSVIVKYRAPLVALVTNWDGAGGRLCVIQLVLDLDAADYDDGFEVRARHSLCCRIFCYTN